MCKISSSLFAYTPFSLLVLSHEKDHPKSQKKRKGKEKRHNLGSREIWLEMLERGQTYLFELGVLNMLVIRTCTIFL